MTVVAAQPAAEASIQNGTTHKTKSSLKARSYQLDLVEVATNNNVIISLATGAGKTLIAAEVIRRKLPQLKKQHKAVLFLAPTNPLVTQQCDVALGGTHGFKARAYHGARNNHHMSSWDRAKWEALVADTDVFVMTPDVLLHTLSHGVFRMSDIGLMIFDEAHHCKSDHPYNQLLQDFYHPLEPTLRPQILGLTASPDGVEAESKRRKGRRLHPGLQHNMNAYLITVPAEGPLRCELNAAVPWPSTHSLTYQAVPAVGVIADSLTWLNWMKNMLLKPAKRCEQICEMLRRQELLASAGYMEAGLSTDAFEGFAEGGRVSALDKQIRGVLYCLENLGPWCAAAAAYLDLLAPPEAGDVDEELQEEQLDDPDWGKGEGGGSDNEIDDDDDDPGIPITVGGDSCRIFDDELGGPPELLLQELRHLLGGIVEFLQLHAEDPNLSFIITPDKLTEATTPRPHDLPAAAAAAEATRQIAEAQAAGEVGGIAAGGFGTCAGGSELEWCARGILRLTCKVALLITMNVLADVLVDDKELKQKLMRDAGGLSSGSDHFDQRSSGSLQGFAEVLLRRVPFSTLEAQIWPELYADKPLRPWHGPPLLTHKVITLLKLLESDRQRCMKETADRLAAAAAGGGDGIAADDVASCSEDWWASMVFVETKLSALVLSKLLMSLPLMRLQLRSGYLLGDTRGDGTAGGLAMNNKQQAQVVAGFRTSAINVLIATSVGSEGMDFKQCQLVVAFDLPRDVTSYIQCRGRGRKAGSRYCFMQQEEHKENIMGLIRKADRLEARVREISADNRKLLEQHAQAAAAANGSCSSSGDSVPPALQLRSTSEPVDHGTRLMTGVGAVVTLRLAQQMLAEYCAKLPGSDRSTPLQAYYSTHVAGGLFHSVVYLPSNAGIQTKVDDAPPGLSSKQAKQHAALQVLRLLYQAGKLNEHLQPVWITQKHGRQLEAEPIPHLTAELRLRRPLHPRPLATAWQQQQQGAGSSSRQKERTLVLHLHTFIYGKPKNATTVNDKPKRSAAAAANPSKPTDPEPQQQQQQGTAKPLISNPNHPTVSDLHRAAEASLLSAVVGSDDAVAALPGGPTVVGGMCGVAGRLCWGVLMWEKITDEITMRWPAWIDKQLYVMDVEYAGPVTLSESQVNQLLGYQCALNGLINWDKTRAEWLRIARELDQQEAAAAANPATAAAAAAGDQPTAMDVDAAQPPQHDNIANAVDPSPMASSSAGISCEQQQQYTGAEVLQNANGVLGTTHVAAQQQQQQHGGGNKTADLTAAADRSHKQQQQQQSNTTAADQQQEQQQQGEQQVQRQPMLPFKPDLLRDLMHWNRGLPWQQQQHEPPAAAAAGGEGEQLNQDPWTPPDRLSYLIVPITSSSSSSGGGSSARGKANPAPAVAAVDHGANAAPDRDLAKSPVGCPMFESDISNVGHLTGGFADPITGAHDAQTHAPAAAAAASAGSSGISKSLSKLHKISLQQLTIDWSSIRYMASGLLPLSHFISQRYGLPEIPNVPAERIELPPLVPPEPVSDALVAAAAAAGEPVPLQGAAAMAAVHPRITPAQVLDLERDLKDCIVVAGHSSHVYTALGVAGGLTPSTSLSASILHLAKQLGVSQQGISNPAGGISNPALRSVGTSNSQSGISNPETGVIHPEAAAAGVGAANQPEITNQSSAARVTKPLSDPSLTPDVMMTNLTNSWAALLSSKNPELAAAVMLSSSMVQHDPDQRPMLGWKVGKTLDGMPIWDSVDRHDDYYRIRSGITGLRSDLPMLAVKSSRGLTGSCLVPPKEVKNVITLPAVAAAAGVGGEQQQQGSDADAAAAAGSSGSCKRGAEAAATASSVEHGGLESNGPDKRQRTAAAGDVTTAAAADTSALLKLQQQQSDTPCFATHELPAPEDITKESAQLANMSRSGRRKVWAKHRVMFLPLELVWLLPITSSAWSQLQLIPNIICRLDSILTAVSMHDQLRELLHGGGAAAAARVCNAPAQPDLEDQQLAAADRWDQPLAMHDLMSDISHRELLSPQQQQQQAAGPDSQAAQAAAAAGPEGQAGADRPDGSAAAAEHNEADQANGCRPGNQAAAAARPDKQSAAASTATAVQSDHSNASSAAPMTGDGGSSATAYDNAAQVEANAAAAAAGSSNPSSSWKDIPVPSPTLLLVALTASSCHEMFDLERLEFLGDVILKVLTSHCLLKAFPPDANEGELSVAKARIIRNLRLAQLGRSAPLYLQYQLRLFPYDNNLWTPTGTQSVLGLFDSGRSYTCKGKRIADGVESLIGAFYVAGAAKEAASKAAGASAGAAINTCAADAAELCSGADVTSWVWHRVSRGGLVAAAGFCEVVGTLPKGAAKYLTGSPMTLNPKDSNDVNSMSLLHPSYSRYYNARLSTTDGAAAAAAAAGGGDGKVALLDKLAGKYSSRIKKLPAGAFPYTFRDPAWLVQSLTHVSVLGCGSYQRLEFLGDALMDLLVSLRTLSQGRERHLGPGALTKARARSVSNNMMATAAVMSGLHLLLHANSWRLLVAVRRFARETLTMFGKLPEKESAEPGVRTLASTESENGQSATAAAIRLAANAGVLSRAAIAAESAGASKESVLAAAAAAASKAMAEAVAGALGAGAAALANRLAQDVLDDDTLWMAVWLRKKELAALQAAAAKAAKEAAAKASAAAAAQQDLAASSNPPAANPAVAAVPSSSNEGCDVAMTDAENGGSSSDDIAKELQQHVAAAAEAAAEAQVAKRKFPKVLADLIESLTAAVYVDSGGDWESTWRVGEYLLCRHEQEVERIEAQQQQQQQQQEGQQQQNDGDEDQDGLGHDTEDLLMMLSEDAE